ncbi:MAG TPA: outer membrane protein transport protein [Deltaproteobacteria bacterium]|nr:outer membrane protein transport protein [Deltaproteobacteria bacterium]
MKKSILIFVFLAMIVAITSAARATNGDNMIAIGPIARSMGGVGVAAPQDAISAVFANPASMCFAPFCNATTFDFAGTLFMPKVDAKQITASGGIVQADSDDKVYAIPAIGLSVPINDTFPSWRFGIAAYGVSGLGVDYRGTDLDNPTAFMGNPLIAGEYTNLQIMKFAPAVAVQALDNLSLGMAIHVDYANLDLRDGSSPNYGYGLQAGLIYTLTDKITFGTSYITAQTVKHKNITDFDWNGALDDLELEAPQQIGFGVAYTILDPANLVIEADAKWLNWSDAKGYKDFDWDDQWVYAIGVQFKPTDRLTFRVGYNYGKNPVNEHDGFDGTFQTVGAQVLPNSVRTVQGATLPTYYYETFRIIGFPAIVEQHLTLGLGIQVTDDFSVNIGYMQAFEETISQTGTTGLDLMTEPVTLESTLSETSLEFGLTWLF